MAYAKVLGFLFESFVSKYINEYYYDRMCAVFC